MKLTEIVETDRDKELLSWMLEHLGSITFGLNDSLERTEYKNHVSNGHINLSGASFYVDTTDREPYIRFPVVITGTRTVSFHSTKFGNYDNMPEAEYIRLMYMENMKPGFADAVNGKIGDALILTETMLPLSEIEALIINGTNFDYSYHGYQVMFDQGKLAIRHGQGDYVDFADVFELQDYLVTNDLDVKLFSR